MRDIDPPIRDEVRACRKHHVPKPARARTRSSITDTAALIGTARGALLRPHTASQTPPRYCPAAPLIPHTPPASTAPHATHLTRALRLRHHGGGAIARGRPHLQGTCMWCLSAEGRVMRGAATCACAHGHVFVVRVMWRWRATANAGAVSGDSGHNRGAVRGGLLLRVCGPERHRLELPETTGAQA